MIVVERRGVHFVDPWCTLIASGTPPAKAGYPGGVASVEFT